jgi:hypothetical protein
MSAPILQTSPTNLRLSRPMKVPAPYEFGVLQGHLEEASAIMQATWAQNVERALEYTPEFLASCLDYPGVEPDQSPAIYKDGKLLAFIMGLPRYLNLDGRKLKLLLPTLFTVSSEARSFGAVLWTEALRRGYEAGYDGTIHFCAVTNKSNEITTSLARLIGLKPQLVKSVGYLMGLPPAAPQPETTAEAAPEEFCRAFLHHAKQVRSPAARLWTIEEVRWQCETRTGSVKASFRGDPQRGLLTGYIQNIADAKRTPCLLIEDIFWGSLHQPERVELLRQFMQRATAAKIAVVPQLGYADMSPFVELGFRPSPRKMNLYLTLWSGCAPDSLDSVYIDVF